MKVTVILVLLTVGFASGFINSFVARTLNKIVSKGFVSRDDANRILVTFSKS